MAEVFGGDAEAMDARGGGGGKAPVRAGGTDDGIEADVSRGCSAIVGAKRSASLNCDAVHRQSRPFLDMSLVDFWRVFGRGRKL